MATNGTKVKEKTITINALQLRKKFANIYGTFGSDPILEQKGVVMEYELQNGEIFELKIKRAGARNTVWRKLYNQLLRPVEDQNQAGEISETENHYMMAELYAKSCVIGWKGLKDADGNEVPFSIGTCLELFCFMPELLTKVINDCHERSNFAHKEKEATAKN